MNALPARAQLAAPLLWAIFLAVSWTWCIGMFLPVLLVRDYGIVGFVVFALPNVLGAAAMGWVIRTRDASRRCVVQHELVVRLFSAVTVGFHLWFVWYLSQSGWIDGAWWPWISVGIFGLALYSGLKAEKPAEALTPFFMSILVILFAFTAGLEVRFPPVTGRAFFGVPAIAWVGLVCTFGFVLCPYLDATFHRARQALEPAGARAAFSLGFCVFFFVMILFTAAYAGLLLGIATAAPRVLTAIVLHMLIQSGFTCGLHIREITSSMGTTHRVRLRGAFVSAGVIALLAGAVSLLRLRNVDNISPAFELGYRVFLSSYGLLFPAYVWLVMIPLRGSQRTPGPRHLTVWILACALAAPAFWMGFVEKQEWWLAPGLIVLLGARWLIPRTAREVSPTQALPDRATLPFPMQSPPAEAAAPCGEVPDSRP